MVTDAFSVLDTDARALYGGASGGGYRLSCEARVQRIRFNAARYGNDTTSRQITRHGRHKEGLDHIQTDGVSCRTSFVRQCVLYHDRTEWGVWHGWAWPYSCRHRSTLRNYGV